MNPSRKHRIGVMAVLAFTGPVAAAGLPACSDEDTSESAQPSATATVTVPTGLRWQTFQGVDLPVADQGPRHTDGPVASGFARSPAGAALTAIHATVRISIATDNQWPAVGQRMLAPGPGRDSWATARAQISITTPITSGAPKVLGYVIPRYTPTPPTSTSTPSTPTTPSPATAPTSPGKATTGACGYPTTQPPPPSPPLPCHRSTWSRSRRAEEPNA